MRLIVLPFARLGLPPERLQIEDADSAGPSNITTTAILLLHQDVISTEGALYRSMTFDNL